jgi:hypothetical protein
MILLDDEKVRIKKGLGVKVNLVEYDLKYSVNIQPIESEFHKFEVQVFDERTGEVIKAVTSRFKDAEAVISFVERELTETDKTALAYRLEEALCNPERIYSIMDLLHFFKIL